MLIYTVQVDSVGNWDSTYNYNVHVFFKGIMFREFGLSDFSQMLFSRFGYIATPQINDHMLILIFANAI